MNRTMVKLLVSLVAVGLLVSVGAIGCQPQPSQAPKEDGYSAPRPKKTPKKAGFSFSNPKKTPHYESNTPAHAAVLAAVPTNVVIDFNFDLAPESSISIKKDGKEYAVGQTVIDDNKLAMRRDMDADAPNGLYTVNYQAYWPDKSSHDGSFQFAIDKKKAGGYKDLTGNTEVTIKLINTSFEPKNVIIDKSTKVTWINEDSLEHFVNTDGHPAHTYYPNQNSRGLNQGDSFSVTFDKPGTYPYHCSAHADQMTAAIIVK